MIIKTDAEGFTRDPSSSALINTNAAAYVQYKEKRKQQQDYNVLKNDVDSLKEDLGSIKTMLQILIQRENNGSINR